VRSDEEVSKAVSHRLQCLVASQDPNDHPPFLEHYESPHQLLQGEIAQGDWVCPMFGTPLWSRESRSSACAMRELSLTKYMSQTGPF
jgi:hypothetical protein